MIENRRELVDAAFAVNEGAWGELDAAGKRVALQIQAGEKTSQNFRLEVTNPGGHSSRPVKNNAITHLAGALTRIASYEFPAQFNDGNRAYFTAMAKIQDAKGAKEIADAMRAFLANPADAAAIAMVSAKDPSWNATLRTTCVATTLDAGHATNALPQRARANVNCRIFPGVDREELLRKLEELAADTDVKVATLEVRNENPPVPPLTRAIMVPLEKLTAKYFPEFPSCQCCSPVARTVRTSIPPAFRLTASCRSSSGRISGTFTDSMSTWASSRCSSAAISCTSSSTVTPIRNDSGPRVPSRLLACGA